MKYIKFIIFILVFALLGTACENVDKFIYDNSIGDVNSENLQDKTTNRISINSLPFKVVSTRKVSGYKFTDYTFEDEVLTITYSAINRPGSLIVKQTSIDNIDKVKTFVTSDFHKILNSGVVIYGIDEMRCYFAFYKSKDCVVNLESNIVMDITELTSYVETIFKPLI